MPTSVTNAEKLSGSWSVNDQVSVSDGFYVSGAGSPRANYFFKPNGEAFSKAQFVAEGTQYTSNGFDAAVICDWNTGDADVGIWRIKDNNDSLLYWSPEDVEFPWQVVVWRTDQAGDPINLQVTPVGVDPLPTLTNPALQQYNTPSTAQGGVFVAGGTQDGVYTNGGIANTKEFYNPLGSVFDPGNAGFYWEPANLHNTFGVTPTVPGWAMLNAADSTCVYYSLSPVATPNLSGTDKFVMAYNGVAYSQRGTSGSKPYFNKIGSSNSTTVDAIVWGSAVWTVFDNGGLPLDTSANDTATPDLATFVSLPVTNVAWLNASDDTPASITVSNVTVQDLVAGIVIGSVTYTVNGALNGRNNYSDVLGVALDVHWNGSDKWIDDNGGTYNLGNVPFPFSGTPEVTVTEWPQAAEANWTLFVPSNVDGEATVPGAGTVSSAGTMPATGTWGRNPGGLVIAEPGFGGLDFPKFVENAETNLQSISLRMFAGQIIVSASGQKAMPSIEMRSRFCPICPSASGVTRMKGISVHASNRAIPQPPSSVILGSDDLEPESDDKEAFSLILNNL